MDSQQLYDWLIGPNGFTSKANYMEGVGAPISAPSSNFMLYFDTAAKEVYRWDKATAGWIKGLGGGSVGTTDYCFGLLGNQGGVGDIPLTLKTGNMVVSTPYITLKANRTYILEGQYGIRGSNFVTYAWVDASNTQLPYSNSAENSANNTSDPMCPLPIASAVITPTVDMQVKMRVITVGTGGSGIDIDKQFFRVQQIGITASTSSTVEYGYFKRTANQTTGIAVGNPIIFTDATSNLPYDPSTGKITLKAGKTYKITGSLGGVNPAAYASAQWRDITNNVYLGNVSVRLPATATSTWASEWAPCTAIVCPSSDIQIQLWIVSASSLTAVGASEYGYNTFSWAMVEQIGTTVSSTTVEGAWCSYTPVIGSFSGTAPTIGSGGVLRGRYKVNGKSLRCRILLSQASAGASGSGHYSLTIPDGYTIDTVANPVATELTTVGQNAFLRIASVVPAGTGNISVNSTNVGSVNVIVASNKTVCLQAYNNLIPYWWGNYCYSLTGANTQMYVEFEVTIL